MMALLGMRRHTASQIRHLLVGPIRVVRLGTRGSSTRYSSPVRPCPGRGLSSSTHLHLPALASGSLDDPTSSPPHNADQADPASGPGPGPFSLRPYQAHAVQACLDALSVGVRRMGVSMPTGSGKTTVFMNLIPLVSSLLPESTTNETLRNTNADVDGATAQTSSVRRGELGQVDALAKGRTRPGDSGRRQDRGKTLVLVGRLELANQAEQAARRIFGPSWSVEVEQSQRRASGLADVTVATYQTLINADRLAKFDPAKYKLIIVDEAHHAAAQSYLRLLHYFNNSVELPPDVAPIEPPTSSRAPRTVPIVGFSATFSRPDQLALSSVFEKIVYHLDICDMLEDGWLAPARSTTVKAALGLEEVEDGANGDFKTTSLAKRVNTNEVNSLVLGTYLHKAGARRSTLVFCVDLDHVSNLTNTFRAAGVDARSISSMSKAHVRKETIAAFGRGEFPVLINCEVLTEGTDIPEIDCILLARPTKSRNLLAQMVGRGLRLSPETSKIDCHIIDIVDSVGKANGMLVSPTLLGLSHEEKEQRMSGTDTGEGKARERPTPGPLSDDDYEVTYIDQDDPFRVAPDARPVLDRASMSAWVACGKGKFVLEAMGSGYLAIAPTDKSSQAKYVITYRHSIPAELAGTRGAGAGLRPPFGRVRTVGYADDLERAVQTGDKFAERQLGRELFLQLSRHAPWRQRPASERAVYLLMKLQGDETPRSLVDDEGREKVLGVFGKMVPVGQLTAGQVSSWLCAAKHGAKSVRAAQDRAEARDEAKRAAKAEKERLHDLRNLRAPKRD